MEVREKQQREEMAFQLLAIMVEKNGHHLHLIEADHTKMAEAAACMVNQMFKRLEIPDYPESAPPASELQE